MKKSGHGPRSVFAAKIADEKHPITAGLKGFQANDELYAKLQGTEPINVLVETYSDWSKKTEPLLFWLPYGQGRVVHSTFGHDTKAIATPEVTTIIARGVEWAATGKVSQVSNGSRSARQIGVPSFPGISECSGAVICHVAAGCRNTAARPSSRRLRTALWRRDTWGCWWLC